LRNPQIQRWAALLAVPALPGVPEQVRKIAALLEFLDSLAEFVASGCRVGIGLLAGDDGPDRGGQCLPCKSRGQVRDVPHAASDRGPPWIAAFLDLVSRFTLVSTRCRVYRRGCAC
jgi:hypothetical protein